MPCGLKPVRHRRDDALARIGWQALETLLAAHYGAQGYDVEHCGTGATGARFDGGIDLKLRRGDEYILVQAKHWNAYRVPHNDVHELLGLMVNAGATGAILVTSGEFTTAAVEAASRQGHVQLVDGDALRAMVDVEAVGAPVADAAGADASEAGVSVADAMDVRPWAGDATVAEAGVRDPAVELVDVMRVRRGPVSRRGHEARRWPVGMVLFVAVSALVFVLLIRGVLEKTKGTARPSRPDMSRAAVDEVELDVHEVVDEPAYVPPADGDCTAVVTGADGVYSDGCAGTTGADKASRRAAQRRADEAARVLEASTPEM